jgi:hypothetical protein
MSMHFCQTTCYYSPEQQYFDHSFTGYVFPLVFPFTHFPPTSIILSLLGILHVLNRLHVYPINTLYVYPINRLHVYPINTLYVYPISPHRKMKINFNCPNIVKNNSYNINTFNSMSKTPKQCCDLMSENNERKSWSISPMSEEKWS